MAGFARVRNEGRNAFQTSAKIHFTEKKFGGLGALKQKPVIRGAGMEGGSAHTVFCPSFQWRHRLHGVKLLLPTPTS